MAIFIRSLCYFSFVLVGTVIQASPPSDLEFIYDRPFHLEEKTRSSLDGSQAASQILRTSETYQQVSFVNETEFRVKRESPFVHLQREYWMDQGTWWVMTSNNRKIPPQNRPDRNVLDQAVYAPLSYARAWGFADKNEDFESFWKRVKDASQPLENEKGARMEIQKLGVDAWLIKSSGTLLHDEKTEVRVESEWTLRFLKPEELTLNQSHLRSLAHRSDP
jgi:hypothetical protein